MRIYIASKASHRPRWRMLRDAGTNIISRWIDVDDKFTTDPTGLDYAHLWSMCVEDVSSCDVLVCYCLNGEVLKGALIEVGMALALNKRIVLSGTREAYASNGTWLHHPDIQLITRKNISRILVELSDV